MRETENEPRRAENARDALGGVPPLSEKEKKIQQKRAIFRERRAELLAQGYVERDATFSVSFANVWGFIVPIPFVLAVILPAVFMGGMQFGAVKIVVVDWLILIAAMVASIPVHELLHGLFWGIHTRFRGISFGIAGVNPYCACDRPQRRLGYVTGTLAPLAVLGGGFCIAGYLLKSWLLLILSVYNIVCAGGDILIAFRAVFCRARILLDHPERCGFAAFYEANQKTPALRE